MAKKKKVSIYPVDLYRFLIEGNRYGFTRNNHLMPGGAFDACRHYLPALFEADEDIGLSTARQLAEEAIEQLRYDSFAEDKRRFSVKIKEKGEWRETKLEFSPNMDFYVFDTITIDEDSEVWITAPGLYERKLLSFTRKEDGKLALNREEDVNIRHYATLYTKDKEGEESYSSVPWYMSDFDAGDVRYVMVRRSRDPGLLDVQSYIEFIDYCLAFLEEHEAHLKKPYNLSDYIEYKSSHGIK